MKFSLFYLLLISIDITAQSGSWKDLATLQAVRGDFDGNGKKEKASISYQKEGCCSSSCKIVFSDARLKPIKFDVCYALLIQNEGDLNNDKTDEISLIPATEQGNWQHLEIWSWKANKWKRKAYFSVHSFQIEDNHDLVKKSKKKGYIQIEEAEFDEEMTEMVFKTKNVLLK